MSHGSLRLAHRVVVAVAVGSLACSSAQPEPIGSATPLAGPPSAGDVTRGQELSRLYGLGDLQKVAISRRSQPPDFPPQLAGKEGAVIMMFIVDSSGRVESDSRTILFLDGEPAFGPAVCDALLGLVFQSVMSAPLHRDATTMPFAFARDRPSQGRAQSRVESIQARVQAQLRTQTAAERAEWIAARPACARR